MKEALRDGGEREKESWPSEKESERRGERRREKERGRGYEKVG